MSYFIVILFVQKVLKRRLVAGVFTQMLVKEMRKIWVGIALSCCFACGEVKGVGSEVDPTPLLLDTTP